MNFRHRKYHSLHKHVFSNLAKHKIEHSHKEHRNSRSIHFSHYAPMLLSLMAAVLPLYLPSKHAYGEAANYVYPNKRNRFQNFFYKLSTKIERACSSIETKIESIRAYGNDL